MMYTLNNLYMICRLAI